MLDRSVSRFVFAALVAGLFAAGCSREAPMSSASAPAVQVAATTAPAPGGGGSDALAPAGRAMRVSTETTVVVADLDASIAAVRREVQASGGYVSEAHVSGTSGRGRSASLEVRVPTGKLGGFRGSIARLGDVMADTEKSEDVTEQRADIDARLGNARAEEKRLLALLAERTGSLADVVAVEKEIAQERETVERMEAQQRVLEGQIAFATSKIQLETRYEDAPAVGASTKIGRAAVTGVAAAGTFLVGLGVVLASSAPTLAIIALLGYGIFRAVRFFVRRSRKARALDASKA